MRKYADAKRIDKQFEVDTWVWAKFHKYKQVTAARRLNVKLSKRYCRPFHIIAKVGNLAYILDLPQNCKVHPVLHVSLLKPYVGPILPTIVNADALEQQALPQPHAIVADKTSTAAGNQYQVVVEWQDRPRENATWEDWGALVELYGAQALEGNELFEGRGNITPQNRIQ